MFEMMTKKLAQHNKMGPTHLILIPQRKKIPESGTGGTGTWYWYPTTSGATVISIVQTPIEKKATCQKIIITSYPYYPQILSKLSSNYPPLLSHLLQNNPVSILPDQRQVWDEAKDKPADQRGDSYASHQTSCSVPILLMTKIIMLVMILVIGIRETNVLI